MPKTAREILEEFHKQFIHDSCDLPDEGKCDCGMDEFLLSSMRAAIEAVRPTHNPTKSLAPRSWETLETFDANISHFFNDDPTSPPTPRN